MGKISAYFETVLNHWNLIPSIDIGKYDCNICNRYYISFCWLPWCLIIDYETDRD